MVITWYDHSVTNAKFIVYQQILASATCFSPLGSRTVVE